MSQPEINNILNLVLIVIYTLIIFYYLKLYVKKYITEKLKYIISCNEEGRSTVDFRLNTFFENSKKINQNVNDLNIAVNLLEEYLCRNIIYNICSMNKFVGTVDSLLLKYNETYQEITIKLLSMSFHKYKSIFKEKNVIALVDYNDVGHINNISINKTA